jgi:hypothetical protein
MIAAPGFYAEHLGEPYVEATRALEIALPGRAGRLLASRARLRAVALGWLVRRGQLGLVAIRGEPGTLAALAVCALPPARQGVFVCELLRRPPSRSAQRRLARSLWSRLVEGPALRRGMAGAQVMTTWEREDYAAAYGLDPARLHLIRWALREGGGATPAAIETGSRRVFSSGRTACDWETLFAAAAGAGWELTVVCSRADAARVHALAAGADRAEVAVELPWAEHDRLLRGSAVCVIAIADRGVSAGQVRLMSAVEAGVPVVATAARSLEEYVVAGDTAIVVKGGDPAAMRTAVDDLLADPERRRELRDRARERASDSTYVQYFDQLRAVIGQTLRGVR